MKVDLLVTGGRNREARQRACRSCCSNSMFLNAWSRPAYRRKHKYVLPWRRVHQAKGFAHSSQVCLSLGVFIFFRIPVMTSARGLFVDDVGRTYPKGPSPFIQTFDVQIFVEETHSASEYEHSGTDLGRPQKVTILRKTAANTVPRMPLGVGGGRWRLATQR